MRTALKTSALQSLKLKNIGFTYARRNHILW